MCAAVSVVRLRAHRVVPNWSPRAPRSSDPQAPPRQPGRAETCHRRGESFRRRTLSVLAMEPQRDERSEPEPEQPAVLVLVVELRLNHVRRRIEPPSRARWSLSELKVQMYWSPSCSATSAASRSASVTWRSSTPSKGDCRGRGNRGPLRVGARAPPPSGPGRRSPSC